MPPERRTFVEAARRAQIIESAIEVLATIGYAHSTMARIAEQAGISTGVISYHFGGKTQLIQAVVTEVAKLATDLMVPRILAQPTATQGLRAYIESNLDFMRLHRKPLLALVEIVTHAPGDRGRPGPYAAQAEVAITDLEKVLEWGHKSGEFRDFDRRSMAIAVRGAIDAVPGAAGMVSLVSVVGLVPGIDPKNRGGNPLRTSDDDGTATGMAYLMLVLVAVTGTPAVLAALWWGWWGVAVGLLTGALCWWGLGLVAERRLAAQGPELLQLMRTGRRPESAKPSPFEMPANMPKTQQTIVMIFMTLGAIPLVPQGIIAAIFFSNGQLDQSWFLATYMPPGLRWPVAVLMMLIGLGMYGYGLLLWQRAKKVAAT